MKMSAKRALSIFLTFVLIFIAAGSCLCNIALATSTNLLQNGSFEDFDGTNFTNWELWPGNHGNTELEQVDGRSDKAAKITVNDYTSIVNLYQGISLDAEYEYTFSAWIKVENIEKYWDGAPGIHVNLRRDNTELATSDAVNINTDWQKIEFTVDASTLQDGVSGLRFDIAVEYVTGIIYIDDATLVKVDNSTPTDTPDSNELLKNNGFEVYSGDSFENWGLWPGNHGNTTIEQVDGRTDKAAKITINDNSSIVNLYQVITLDPDAEYTFTAWVKAENVVRLWDSAPGIHVNLWCDNTVKVESQAVNTDADWQKIEFNVDGSTLQGNEVEVRFDISIDYVQGDFYIDDASLKVKEDGSDTEDPEPTPTPTPDPEPTPEPDEDDNQDDDTDSDELLKNKDLEAFESGSFTHWTLWKGNNGNTELEQVDGRTGKAAKITVDNNNNTVNLYQSITLDPSCKYTFSAWVRTENIALQWDGANGVYLNLSYNNNIPLVKSELIKADSDWQKLEFVFDGSVLNGDEWAVNFDIAAEYLTGVIYVDDAELKIAESDSSTQDPVPTPTPTPDDDENSNDNNNQNQSSDPDELLVNNGFEVFSDGSFTDWTLWKGNQGNTKLEQVAGRTGNAAKITVDNNNNTVNLYQDITLDPAYNYTLTAWVKTENIALQWDGANGVYLCLSYNNNIPLIKSELIKTDSDWQKLEIVVNSEVLKGNEWSVNFDIVAEYLTGIIYVDDVSLKVTGKSSEKEELTPVPDDDSDELLKNKGFEKYSGGNFANWTLWKGNKGNTKLEQVDGRNGKAAKITVDNNENIVNLYQEIKLDPTLEYTFSVWVKTENIALQWSGAQGVYLNLSCDNSKVLMSESVNANSNWQKLEVVVNGGVLDGDEWSIRFDVAAEYLTGDIYIDDAAIEVTGVATPVTKPDADELLKNNSFEIFSAGNFAHWTMWKGNKGNTKLEQVDGRTGKAAKITVDNNNNIVNLYQEIKLDPECEYTFTAWVKTENIALQWPGAQGVYLNLTYNNNVVLMSKPITVDSDWQKLELVVNGGILKGEEWGVRFDIAAEFLTGNIYIDDVSLKVTGKGSPVPDESPDELLKNSSFELYSGYNFARWNLNRGNKGNTKLEQVDGRNGKAARIIVDDNNNIVSLYQNITLDPAYEYTFSVWVKVENIKLQWEGAQGIYLSLGYNNTNPVKSASITTDTNGWQKLEVVVSGALLKGDEWGVMFALVSEFITGTIYVDDASMKITGKAQPRADSLLENTSFDNPDDDTVIEGWTAFTEDMFSVLDRSTSMVKDGIASAQIFNTNENIVSTWEQRLENLDVSKEYVLSGYIYSDFIVSDNYGAAAFVEFYDPDGNLIKTERSDYVKGEQTDWTYFELKLAFPENCVTMVVKAGLKKAVGTAYFDMFTLEELTDAHTEAKEGVFENLFFMGITEEENVDGTVNNESGANKTLIIVIIAVSSAVVLLGIGTTLTVLIIKKKKRMIGDKKI